MAICDVDMAVVTPVNERTMIWLQAIWPWTWEEKLRWDEACPCTRVSTVDVSVDTDADSVSICPPTLIAVLIAACASAVLGL